MKRSGLVALVTGGGQGIGEAIARRLAADGVSVVVGDIDPALAEAVARDIAREDGQVTSARADVTDRSQVEALVRHTISLHGRIDILVNNAGTTARAKITEMTDEQWDRVVEVNLRGAFLCSRAVVPAMIAQRWGRIISISSIAHHGSSLGQSHYSASKAGLIGLTRSLALELGRYGITVNAVAPGFIDTPLFRDNLIAPEKEIAYLEERTALRRLGRPEDIAAAVAFLASDDAAFITGQVLEVDGGIAVGIN